MGSVHPPRWDVIAPAEVHRVIERAARKVNDVRGHTTEFEDLVQEGLIRVATTADLIVCVEDEHDMKLGLLYERLRRDLMDMTDRDDRNLGSRLSYERLIENFEE